MNGNTRQNQIACRFNPSTDSYLYLKITLTDPFCPLKLYRTTPLVSTAVSECSFLQISMTLSCAEVDLQH